MHKSGLLVNVLSLLLLTSCISSCERKPGRPAASMCTFMEDDFWECEDSFGNIRKEQPENLVATTWNDYTILEKYIDSKEKKVRELERQLAQCK